ncbi:hypothetical protein CARUB_v10016523mg [Capsella rubella]|uniref:D-isomer specific 2-hydroxyacid dehydrogenase NAD-binding domain-containing protein n=1 Tax=Capsella rubella TaxID=81985 RepID=R0GIS1_9BRAS|nr:hypothetical protein CARUB_v10016523mg [Capsella rubella]
MAMRQARAYSTPPSSGYFARRHFNIASLTSFMKHSSSSDSKNIVGVFYKANEYATKNPNFLGCVENALGIRDWLESQGHQYIVTDDKEGPNCKNYLDLHVLISTPFHPAYVNAERIKKAKNMKLLLTTGIGLDHIDLQAAAAVCLTVVNGEWDVASISYRAYDVERKTIGTVGAGRIRKLLLQRLKPFGCNLLYHDRLQMAPEMEKEIGAKYVEDMHEMLSQCDIVVINMPLTEKTRFCLSYKGLFKRELIWKMKKGVLIVNNARGAIMESQAVVEAMENGHIGGYNGDVWDPQPAPKDHPWRYMPNQAMTPHISGTTIDAQRYFKGEDFPAQNYIFKDGELAPQ